MKTTKNIVYDNCKDCASHCEHAGKDRTFVCPHGISCKKPFDLETQKAAAIQFCTTIKLLAEKPENLENLESYLSYHFKTWLEKFANTPEDITAELKNFAEMEL